MVRPKVLKKRLAEAEKLIENNGGKLPHPSKMIEDGHGTLYRYIQRNPDHFSHFERERAIDFDGHEDAARPRYYVSIREQHLETARILRKAHGGKLPSTRWMVDNGHTRLASYIKAYPHRFPATEKPVRKKRKKRAKSTI